MFLLLLCYQYINTRANHKKLLSDGESPETNLTFSNEINTSDVDGIANVTFDSYLGYNIHIPNQTLWTDNILGSCICDYNGLWMYYHFPYYEQKKEDSIIGIFVLLLLTLCITLAITGVWPLMISMSRMVNFIAKLIAVERLEELNEEDVMKAELLKMSKKSRWGHIFKYIWMAISFIVILFLSALLAHFIIRYLGLPTTPITGFDGHCYQLDTTTLGVSDTKNTGKKLQSLLEGTEIVNSAQARINSDGSVDFVVNCETSMYQTSTGALWTIVPSTGITCVDTPAYELVDINGQVQQACTLIGPWYDTDGITIGTQPGYDDSIFFPTWEYGICGLLPIWPLYHRAWVSWKIDKTQKWQFCKTAQQPASLVRKDENGQIQEIVNFGYQLTVDPNALGRQYGWYTSGDREVIATADYQSGKGGHLIFYDPGNWTTYMRSYHISDGGYEPHITMPREVSVHPSSLECKMLINIPNGNDYVEFQEFCSSIWASQADDDVSGIKIMTDNENWCTVDVGFGNVNRTTVISIKINHPVTLLGADRWRCKTQMQFGTSCSIDRNYELFSPEIVNATLATTVSMLSPKAEGNAIVGDLDLFNWLDLSNIGDIFILIGLCLAGAIVLVLLIVVIVKIVKCICRRKATKIVMQQAKRHIMTENLDENADTNHDSDN
jgi:hypothetical protein